MDCNLTKQKKDAAKYNISGNFWAIWKEEVEISTERKDTQDTIGILGCLL